MEKKGKIEKPVDSGKFDPTAIKEKLRKLMPEHSFRMWIEPCIFEGRLISFPKQFLMDRVRKKYMHILLEVYGGQPPIMVVSEKPAETEAPEEPGQPDPTEAEKTKTAPEPKPEPAEKPEQWAPCAAVPTDLCRVSPFFPIARQNMQKRDSLRKELIVSSSWGELYYTGLRLSIYDEDVLFGLLALIDGSRYKNQTMADNGLYTYRYQGTMSPLLSFVYPNVKRFGKTQYSQTIDSLETMSGATIRAVINKKNGGHLIKITNLIMESEWHDDIHELDVIINPFFYEQYAAKTITLIDAYVRAGLRSPIAKSLYRFIMSHRNDKWQGHYSILVAALNMNINQPKHEIKRQIKRSIKTLIDNKLLTAKSGLPPRANTVTLERTLFAKKRRKI